MGDAGAEEDAAVVKVDPAAAAVLAVPGARRQPASSAVVLPASAQISIEVDAFVRDGSGADVQRYAWWRARVVGWTEPDEKEEGDKRADEDSPTAHVREEG